jgi:CopA family copper-resistance protein
MTNANVLRRRLLQAGVGAFVLGVPSWPQRTASASAPTELSGSRFDLSLSLEPVNLTGRRRMATLVNGQLPAPLLRWREGDTVTVRVTNRLRARSSIHWHGMIVPADMDGVPGLSFEGIAPGETFEYRFKVNQSGTYWYHSHSRFQEQTGLYGPIVVEPRNGQRFPAARDYVVLLSDWTDLDPERLFATLKKHSGYFNHHRRTAGDLFADAAARGWRATLAERRMWGQMRMDPTDIADVSGYAYTFLTNGHAPNDNWSALFSRGESVKLRFINGSSMSIFDVRIPGLKLKVVAHDGVDVEPVTVDEFRLGTAETCDVIVTPDDERAYTIFAQSIDRTGYARGTLAPRSGMTAPVPSLDPRPLLTMQDMGMAHGMTLHGRGAGPQQTDHSAHGTASHGSVHGAQDSPSSLDHAPDEFGPTVDMTVEQVSTRLDDPGIGLRNNGRRVLTYADLSTIGGPIDAREASREIKLHLTGHMERFIWSFDGKKFSEAPPIQLRHGERVRFTLVNDTMMTHPIHLHGMWSEIETPSGEFQVRKHTVLVHPAQQISYGVTADALGRWAYHCHLLYHMEAGMFREVSVTHHESPRGEHSEHRHDS